MKCPCICINLLLEHFRKHNSEETFQYLPIRVRRELIANSHFCQKLFHPVFNRENGQRIITERTTNNQELLVWCPTTQQELASPLVHELIQPRKTGTIRKKQNALREREKRPVVVASHQIGLVVAGTVNASPIN